MNKNILSKLTWGDVKEVVMAADKVVGRMKDPNYKRKHPHVSHHNNTVK